MAAVAGQQPRSYVRSDASNPTGHRGIRRPGDLAGTAPPITTKRELAPVGSGDAPFSCPTRRLRG
jgi:hypothetical protein